MAFNLAPDQDAAGVTLSGNLLSNSPMAFTSYNGLYQNVYTGIREVKVVDFAGDSVLNTTSFNFQDSAYYSLFAVGNNGVYKTIIVSDDVADDATSDKAFVRFINAIPDSSAPVVTIAAGGTNAINAPAKFTDVSPFTAVNGGDVVVTLSNGSTISANRTVSLENGKVYTVLLVGDPAATDISKKVQIRYILNGSVPGTTDK